MSYAARHHEFTLDEYLDRDGPAGDKYEFADGQIYAMSGGSPRHNHLAGRIYRLLADQLDDGPCAPLPSDQRIATPDTLYTYADGSVFCGELEMGANQTAFNPTVLVEVLSDSTRAYDRGEKLRRYQTIPALQHVLLVEQDAVDVELWSRGDDGWTRVVHVDADQAVTLTAIGVTLQVGAIYEGVERFPG
ncbi:MAG: Uma2 family endonuclease [Myxococcota bacterium]